MGHVIALVDDNSIGDASTLSAAEIGRRHASVATGVSFIGDSITNQALTSNSTQLFWENIGYITALRQVSQGRIYVDPAWLHAESGEDSDYFVANGFHTAAAADASDICVIALSTNDATNAIAVADSVDNYALMAQTVLKAGKKVAFMSVMPRDLAGTTAAKNDNRRQLNTRMLEYARVNGIGWIDAVTNIIDDTSTDGEPLDAVFRDANHPNNHGTYIMADAAWETLEPYVANTNILTTSLADAYSSDDTSGNLVANGLMAGTAGTAGTGMTGTVADSFTLQRDSATDIGTLTAVGSKVARTDGGLGAWQQIVVSGTPDATREIQLIQTAVAGYTHVAGDVIEGTMKVEWDANSANILGVYGEVLSAEAAGNVRARDGDKNATPNVLTTSARSLVLRTPRLTIGATPTELTLKLIISCDASAAADITLRVGQMAMRRIV